MRSSGSPNGSAAGGFSPATFRGFVAYKTGRFGVWGEFLIDVHFENIKTLDHGMGGLEFLFMNGRGAQHAIIQSSACTMQAGL